MTDQNTLKTYFHCRRFTGRPEQPALWQRFEAQSPSTGHHVVWFVQQEPTPTFKYLLVGPPVLMAACAWLAAHLNASKNTTPIATLKTQCVEALALPYTQHHLVDFAMDPLCSVCSSC